MGLSGSIDVSRITNLENRLDADEAKMITTDDTANQTIKALTATALTAPTATITTATVTTENVTGTNNSLVQTTPVANTQWMAGMEDANTYYWALGRFNSNARNVEFRSYMDNLTLRSGRKAGATAGGISLITNDSNTAGINSDINLSPNTAQGGVTKVNSNLNVTPPNTSAYYMYIDASVNMGINWSDTAGTKAGCKLKFLTDGSAIQARNVADTAFTNFAAAAFTVGSMADTKDNIQDFTETALDKINKTKVRKYTLKNNVSQREDIGLIYEESPIELQQDEGISLYNMCGLLWKAVQELTDQVNTLKGNAK